MSGLVYKQVEPREVRTDWVPVIEYRYQWAHNAYGTATVFFEPNTGRFYRRNTHDRIHGGDVFWFRSNPYYRSDYPHE